MRNGLVGLVSASVIAFTSIVASAADIPAARPVYKAPPAAAVFSWSGFYLGLNAGYGWADVGLDGFTSDRLDGFVGGGQAGYNWQFGNFVLGLEGDFQGSAVKRSDAGVVLGVPVSIEQKIPWFGTVRGRAGLAFDRVMVYATGGWAYVNYELNATAAGVTIGAETSRSGWTIGGGIEWMFVPNWSLKAEYLYIDTDNTTVTLFGVTATGRARLNVARGGINYHF